MARIEWSAAILSACALTAVLARHTHAQQSSAPAHHTEIPAVAPRPEDVSSIDAIVRASYETMSGPAGQPRQWGRDRTLYTSHVYFVQTGVDPGTGKSTARGYSYEEYADQAGPDLEKYGYFEREVGRVVRVFGHVASVASAWEARTTANGKVLARGVNMIQLINDGRRWWITSLTWDTETPGNPIPAELLTGIPATSP